MMTPQEAQEWLAVLDEHGDIDPDATGDALETITAMRYEYAVQVPVNGHWGYTKNYQYGPEVLRNPRDATWYSSRHAAETWADLWDDGEESPRIVRRLVSDPEVAE